jgi:hypothetical protein
MWPAVPTPAEPYVMPCGFFFAAAIKSLIDVSGEPAETTMALGDF